MAIPASGWLSKLPKRKVARGYPLPARAPVTDPPHCSSECTSLWDDFEEPVPIETIGAHQRSFIDHIPVAEQATAVRQRRLPRARCGQSAPSVCPMLVHEDDEDEPVVVVEADGRPPVSSSSSGSSSLPCRKHASSQAALCTNDSALAFALQIEEDRGPQVGLVTAPSPQRAIAASSRRRLAFATDPAVGLPSITTIASADADLALAMRLQFEEGSAEVRRSRSPAIRRSQPAQPRSSALRRLLEHADRDFTANDYDVLLELDAEEAKRTEKRTTRHVERILTQLPVRVVAVGETLPQCSICLEAIASGAEVRTLPCLHTFHRSCCDRWLKTSAPPRCPIDMAEVTL